ncbi:MAG: putative metallophosphoesterase YhaO [Verrucomicrobia subdivision 3 bacterium]|nr:putative metallophosphoesterase YhaO [Limisphaerales bacterium]MCS1416189.1 putative metallophosphoesterase YhaO [Limisphaerales bacterium]
MASQLGPAEAWDRTVKAAVAEQVSAVLLAGDVVDRDDDFFEAYRTLERGVAELTEAGIQVIGVAGNHDVKVLPRLNEQIEAFRLLGANGVWEACHIGGEGAGGVTVWGWSFREAKATVSPLPEKPFERAPGINLGLLHCDWNAGEGSPYAPVAQRELDAAGLDGWLLGHIHKPDVLSVERLNGYLGSLTGMDRGETGDHGPWLITASDGRITDVTQLPIAPLRWKALDVDLEGISEPNQAQDRVLAKLRRLDAELSLRPSPPRALGLTITLSGRTELGQQAIETFSVEDRQSIDLGADARHYFIVKLELNTRPVIDLEELAKRPDPAGLLAARLLWLDREEGDAERDRLLAAAGKALREESDKATWQGLGLAEDIADPVDWLRRAGYRALDTLLAQEAEKN